MGTPDAMVGKDEALAYRRRINSIKRIANYEDDFLAALAATNLTLEAVRDQQANLEGRLNDIAAIASENQIPENPMGVPLSFGKIEFPHGEKETFSEEMPFDGWIARIDAGWPAGAQNAIGFNVRIANGDVIAPWNHDEDVADPQDYFTANDEVFPIFLIYGIIPEGDEVQITIENGAQNTSLDLNPLIVTVTNFNPLLLTSGVS